MIWLVTSACLLYSRYSSHFNLERKLENEGSSRIDFTCVVDILIAKLVDDYVKFIRSVLIINGKIGSES